MLADDCTCCRAVWPLVKLQDLSASFEWFESVLDLALSGKLLQLSMLLTAKEYFLTDPDPGDYCRLRLFRFGPVPDLYEIQYILGLGFF